MAECTIYDKLRYIAETKDLIKAAIEAQDVEVLESATFRQYAEYITQIRKVSSVNGMQGDVTITAKDLGALTEIPSEYITETELNEKGYLTAVPDVYITEDELSSQLADKVSQNGLNEAIEGVRNDIPTNVSELTNDSGYITLNEVPKVDLSGYALKSEIPDISVKQDKLTAGNGISITDNVISLDYEYDLFEVVQSLPTENISDNKVYLLLDSNGSEGNTYVEYLYVNGQWEELGKFKVNIDLSGYATEEWVNSQGFLKEHQDISNLATKAELNAKQDVISDLDSIRSGAAKGATALQTVPSGYATEQWVNEQGFLKEHQDISNLATKEELNTKQDVISDLDTIRSGAALGATALQEVPDTYALKSEIPDISTKQDKLVSGENIKTVNGTSLLGSGNIVIEASAANVPTLQTTKQGTTSNYIYSSGKNDYYGVISNISNGITYSTDKASIETYKYYWGSTSTNVYSYCTLNAATTSQAGLMSASDKTKLDGIDLTTKQDTLVSGTNIKTINGTSLLGSGNISIDTNVDLSNYATKSELNAKQDVINDLDTIRSGAALGATALQAVPSEYVTETELNNKGYLTSVPDTYALKSEIPDISVKQDTLVSGTNIKTINGESILGSGNITIEGGGNVDLTNYYTKTETNELVNPKLEQVTLTQAEYDALQTKEENVLYIISDAEDLKFKTINGQQIIGEGNIEINASADNVPTLQTTPKGTTSNYIYSTGIFDGYGVISDISNAITYSTDKASISTWKRYWGEESSNSYQSWSIEGATTSQAGLMSSSDKSKLDGIDLTYATKTELNAKQDTLVSGTNIKTVNGISLLGEGNITISGEGGADLSGYYTKAEIDAMIGGASATITQINNLVG